MTVDLHGFPESRGKREQESGYFSPDRRGDGEQQSEDVKKTYRYYERGHPLPSNYVLEPKACVPFRNVNLGVPSQRRDTETFIQDSWRSESPQRYTSHSNFRKGTDSETNSPSRHNSVSPDRRQLPESPPGNQRRTSLSRSRVPSRVSSQLPSHAPTRHSSRRSSPSRRRPSNTSRAATPSRATPSYKRKDSFHFQNGDYAAPKGDSRHSGSPSLASNKHSLDSERLYRNLETISHRHSSSSQYKSYEGSPASPHARTAIDSSGNTRTQSSREMSPSRNGSAQGSRSPQRDAWSRDSKPSPSQGSWQGSSHSVLSPPLSHVSGHSFRGSVSNVAPTQTDKDTEGRDAVSGDRSTSSTRRGMDTLFNSEQKKTAVKTEEARHLLIDR